LLPPDCGALDCIQQIFTAEIAENAEKDPLGGHAHSTSIQEFLPFVNRKENQEELKDSSERLRIIPRISIRHPCVHITLAWMRDGTAV
jgi:hypothetical protein